MFPWATRLGPGGQTVYLAALLVPAAILTLPWRVRVPRWRRTLPVAALVALWAGWCLAADLGSPRVATVVDGWRGWVDLVLFAARGMNLLTQPFDADLAGVGAILTAFHGMPLVQAGVVPLTLAAMQVQQIAWLAVCAAGVALLARRLVGAGTELVAVAVFLFAPYTRFVAFFPGPFLVGPLYGTAIALLALTACRRRSNAALAALGAASGVALTYPGVVPAAGFCVLVTLWQLRRDWRQLWVGAAAGLAALVAVVGPALPDVMQIGRMAQHFHLHGTVSLLEPALLGQLPIGAFAEARAAQIWRPLDVVLGALVEPFANARLAIRLWGDAIVDPLGATLLGVGLVACGRAAPTSPGAAFLVAYYVIALAPAFVSPVDRVDIVHAVVIPLPIALLAGAGARSIGRRLPHAVRRGAAAAAVATIAVGGTALFDGVNPRILPASAPAIAIEGLHDADAGRVVVLGHAHAVSSDVRWLFTGPITAFAGRFPLGFLEYDGGPLPQDGFAADGIDVLVWSPGLDADAQVTRAVCAQWPAADVYELRDAADASRVLAADIGGRRWTPALPPGRWRRTGCR
ncbi:MAG: hypothetical protein KIT14_15900 [bacterium]|nr:hypothetical protein [bacterium]